MTWHAFYEGSYPSWANCSPRLENNTPRFWHRERRLIHVSDPDPHLAPNIFNGVHVRTPSWPVHDLHILMCQKKSRVMRCVGRGIVLGIHKVSLQNAPHSGKHINKKSGVSLAVEGSAPSTTSSLLPPWGWGATVTVRERDARIYQSLPLPAAHTSTTNTMKQREARLTTEDTMPSVPEVPPSVHIPTPTAPSPVTKSQSVTPGGTPRPIASDQKPVTLFRTDNLLRNRRQGAEMKRWSRIIRIGCLSFHAPPTFTRPLMSCVAKVCWRVLATYPTFCPFLAENNHQRQSWNRHQYLPFKLRGMMPSKDDKNAKWFIKKHTQYWTVNLLDRLHSEWFQFEWLPF